MDARVCNACIQRKRRKRLGGRLIGSAALLGLVVVAAPQWIGGRSATADATDVAADSDPAALRRRVQAACPTAQRASSEPRSERCLLLRHELDRSLAARHRSLGETALSAHDFGEADRQFRLALTYAGFDVSVADEIRQAAAPAEIDELDGSRLYEARLESVVQVRMSGRLGSGVVVAPGVVLTNAHVLGNEESGVVITASGEEFPFEWALKHPIADVGLVRAPELPARAAPLGAGLALRPGDGVSLIGSPQGLAFSFSNGAVSAVGRRLDDDLATMIQFTAPISLGSSGAPVFDRSGRVAALASLFFDEGQALNFAVPIEYGRELMDMAARL